MGSRRALSIVTFVCCALFAAVLWPSAVSAAAKVKAEANPGRVERIDVMDPGIYTSSRVTRTTNDAGQTIITLSDPQFIAATSTIPAQLGIKFGFRYSVVGQPENATVTVKQITIYPPAGVVSPQSGLLHQSSVLRKVPVGGRPLGAGYDITESWELVPGLWTVQLWVGEQKLAEHSFNLVVKDAAARNIAQPQGKPEAISPPGF